LIGRYALKSNVAFNHLAQEGLSGGHTLSYYTGNTNSSVTMIADFNNKSNNIIKFSNLYSANLANLVTNTSISIFGNNGLNVYSEIISANQLSNTVTIASNVWLTFANVATVTGSSGSNTINITRLTNVYDIVNNGNYSNTSYPLIDIIKSGDNILVANNTVKTVDYVDYFTDNGIIYLTSNLSSNANSYLSVNKTINTIFKDLNKHVPPFTYFGRHPTQQDHLGVWIDLDALHKAESKGTLTQTYNSSWKGIKSSYILDMSKEGLVLYRRKNKQEVWRME
jgi:hypothetical protein